jgi:uncharacterized DUF497 family protein
MIRVEWDDKKAVENYRKHGVRFEDARYVFLDPFRITETSFDDRWQTIGLSGNHVLFFVAHTIHENGVEIFRIITARKATSKERKRYGNRKL